MSGNLITKGMALAGKIISKGGIFVCGGAAGKILGGTTSLSLRNNADSADNLIITDAGAATFRNDVAVPGNLTLTGNQLQGGAAGAALTSTRLLKKVTAIADNTATAVLTVTVPNVAVAAVLNITILSSLGAGGAIGAFEVSNTGRGQIVIARTAGVATVATAATLASTASAAVAGATTATLAYAVSAMTGAVGVTQTFTVTVTIVKGGGSSANHQAVILADLLNSETGGATVA